MSVRFGVDLGWRNVRQIMLNHLGEVIPVPDAAAALLGLTRVDTPPLVANNVDNDPVIGGDALFGLYQEPVWDVSHALASAKIGKERPIEQLVKKLMDDIRNTGHDPQSKDVSFQVAWNGHPSIEAAIHRFFPNVTTVPRSKAAFEYANLILRDLRYAARQHSASAAPDKKVLVIDLGFDSMSFTYYLDGDNPSYSGTLDMPVRAEFRPNGFPASQLLVDVFASWWTFVSQEMDGAAHQFPGLQLRESYRCFDDWWRQMVSSRADGAEYLAAVPFQLPFESNPQGNPFFGCNPPNVISNIISHVTSQLRKHNVATVPKGHSPVTMTSDLTFVFIGQYSELTPVVDAVSDYIKTEYMELFRLTEHEDLKAINSIRLPQTGLAAGASI